MVLELDEGCRSVAALRRIISAALHHLKEDGFDVTVQGRAVEDVDVCGLEEGATIQVVECRRMVALAALRAAGRGERGLRVGMFEAVYDGDVALCEQYLDACGSPFLRECSGALLRAAGLAVCEVLLSRGAIVNASDKCGVTALHGAARTGQLAICQLLLQHGADVNATDKCGGTALHRAARTGQSAICQLLLQHGADVNKQNEVGGTPLHGVRASCCARKSHEVREVLLRDGADMRVRDSAGNSPLGLVRRRWQKVHRFSAFNLFVKYGAPPLTQHELRRPSNLDRSKYTRFIHRLVKVQFRKRIGKRRRMLSEKGMGIVNAFVTDVLERLGGEAGRVTSFSGAKTLSVRSVVAAVKLQLPEELATHALAAGTAAVGRYAKACGGRR